MSNDSSFVQSSASTVQDVKRLVKLSKYLLRESLYVLIFDTFMLEWCSDVLVREPLSGSDKDNSDLDQASAGLVMKAADQQPRFTKRFGGVATFCGMP